METLPEDIKYNILLHLDDDNLNSICSSNLFVNICKNKDIWVQKLINHGLPNLLHNKPVNTNWLVEYQKIIQAHKKTMQLLTLIEHEKLQDHYSHGVSVNISIDELQHVLPNKILIKINMLPKYDKSFIGVWFDKDVSFDYSVYSEITIQGQKIINADMMEDYDTLITMDDAYTILFNVYYYYPYKNLYDSDGWSYNKLKKLHTINIKKVKEKYMIEKYNHRTKLIKEGKL